MSRSLRGFYQKQWEAKLAAPGPPDDLCTEAALAVLAPHAGRFLDVGCGKGDLLAAAASRYDLRVGVDLAEVAVRVSRREGASAAVVNLDNGGLPFAPASFDQIACLEVIEHVLDPIGLALELHRVLRVGGSLILSTPNIRNWRHIRSIAKGRFPRTSTDPFGWDGGHLHYFTGGDIERLLSGAGGFRFVNHGVFGRRSRLSRLLTVMLGRTFAREFLAPGILVQAIKLDSR